MKNPNWSEQEDAAFIADYLSALAQIARGLPVNKSKTRRALLAKLNGRSEGSVEFKRCNISAALVKAGQPYWPGYLPCANYQSRLDSLLASALAAPAAVAA